MTPAYFIDGIASLFALAGVSLLWWIGGALGWPLWAQCIVPAAFAAALIALSFFVVPR